MDPATTVGAATDARGRTDTQRRLAAAAGGLDRFSKWVGNVACLLIIPLMGTIASEIAWRTVFGSSLFWAYDMTYMIYGSLFMLGAGYTLSVGGHIRSDFLYNQFPLRVRGIIDSIAYIVFFFPTIFFLASYGLDNAYDAWQTGERSIASAWMPILYPFRAMIPIAGGLLLIQGVAETIRAAYAATTGREL